MKNIVKPGDRLLLGLSGGVDSMALLDVLARLAKRLRFELKALHVNHQLSPNAGEWARLCRAACRERGIPCRVVRVVVKRGNSLERAARDARYAAFRNHAADYIVLAHNADDQVETVLLQLLRGAGVRGLAAMPLVRCDALDGRDQADRCKTAIVRPLLHVTRAEIEHYAKTRHLAWIEDESNADTVYLRNWLRLDLIPRIATRVPGYRATLTRAAAHCREADEMLDALACLDAGTVSENGCIAVDGLRKLTAPRARNLLRWVIASRGWPMPVADRLDEALRQALNAKRDARINVKLGACELRRKGGVLYLLPIRRAPAETEVVTWRGEREIALPALRGVLVLTPGHGAGIKADRLHSERVTIRTRRGGERLQPDMERPRRTVKNLLQERGVPEWERDRLPFIYCGDALACVPGIAIDQRFQAHSGEASILPEWRKLEP